MPLIELTTSILAPARRCFDLARSIDFHLRTTEHTQETAIAGRTTGLIEAGESVTWRAKHLGLWQTLTSRITVLTPPRHFQDVMTQGPFASMIHDHYFEQSGATTLMRDRFDYRSPLGPLGVLADVLLLERYMRGLLERRALILKGAAESEGWRDFLERRAERA